MAWRYAGTCIAIVGIHIKAFYTGIPPSLSYMRSYIYIEGFCCFNDDQEVEHTKKGKTLLLRVCGKAIITFFDRDMFQFISHNRQLLYYIKQNKI